MYTFDSNLVSDLHKDAFGFRPSKDYMDMWNNDLTDEGRQAEWDLLCKALDNAIEMEKIEEEFAVNVFNKAVNKVIEAAGDEMTALRWMTSTSEHMNNAQDIEHWVWNEGILFTDRGREVVAKLKQIYGVK